MMILTVETFILNEHMPRALHENTFCCYAKASLEKFDALRSQQDKEWFQTSEIFFKTKKQQIKISSHAIMSVFITFMRLFDQDERIQHKKWEEKSGSYENLYLVKGQAALRSKRVFFHKMYPGPVFREKCILKKEVRGTRKTELLRKKSTFSILTSSRQLFRRRRTPR